MAKQNELLYRLAMSSLQADRKTFRLSCLTAIREIQKDDPERAKSLADALSNYDVGANPLRGVGLSPPPIDKESGLDLARVIANPSEEMPILPDQILRKVSRFLSEHMAAQQLIGEGLVPPSSVLLFGEPGVGKTMLGEFMASQTRRELIVLDLASSVSSLLGKTGQNLKKVIEYAKSKPTVLFLDEFDSIAKDRDDRTDLGELKRIVNVLLKELEDWPHYSLLVAATNYPKLLDKAIWRRFDLVLEISAPDLSERKQITLRALDPIAKGQIADLVARFTEGASAADLTKICQRIKRRHLLEQVPLEKVAIEEILSVRTEKKSRNEMIRKIRKEFPSVTLEDIGTWLNLTASTVHYHARKQ